MKHAFKKRAVGAVVEFALVVAGAIGEVGIEEEEDVHGVSKGASREAIA
jgi:cell division septation protein DedD